MIQLVKDKMYTIKLLNTSRYKKTYSVTFIGQDDEYYFFNEINNDSAEFPLSPDLLIEKAEFEQETPSVIIKKRYAQKTDKKNDKQTAKKTETPNKKTETQSKQTAKKRV
jgi:hypothetical protein